MATITPPALPAVSNYPDDQIYESEIKAAKEWFEKELAATESDGWAYPQTKDGVHLEYKPDPEDSYGMPTVRGTCKVEGVTTDELMAVIQLPGMRKLWDPRMESADMLKRFSRLKYEFLSVMKGLGWLVWPRDIVGVQRNFRSSKLGEEITVIQVSVDDPEYPAQSGKVRAKVRGSGWRIKPVGKDVELSYLVNISLEGGLATALVQQLAQEIPTCTGRVRDVYYQHGYPPFTAPLEQDEIATVFHTEHIDLEPTPTWVCSFIAKTGKFSVHYDTTRMFSGGVSAHSDVDGVNITDDGKGLLTIDVTEAANGKEGKIVVTSK